jgi:uncharacterized membrane protein YfcA
VTQALVFGAVFASVLMQTLTGFGSAMVAMALLPYWVGLLVAAPLVALIATTMEVIVLLYWREALDLRAIRQLSAGAVLGVPIGVLALRQVDAAILLPVLGAVIIGYAFYALMRWHLPRLEASGWAYGAGWMAGILGGAYNVTGPPVIVYGHCRRWSPAEFKANLQAFFILADVLVIAGHAIAGNLTRAVWENYLLALPAIALGVLAGLALERFIPPDAFRRTALAVLIALGARLLF